MNSSFLKAFFLAAFSAAALSASALFAGDPAADKLRSIQAKDIVLCSANPKPPYLSVIEALAKLKRGGTLRIAPGDYKTPVVIDLDNVILEADPSSLENNCNYMNLEIKGENCLLRGLALDRVRFAKSLSIVDCAINEVDLYNSTDSFKGRVKFQAANSIFSSMEFLIYDNPCVVDVSSCVLFRSEQTSTRYSSSYYGSLARFDGEIQASFTKTIFYGGPASLGAHVLDDMRSNDRRKIKLNLDSCIFYAESCLATNQDSDSKKLVAHDIKDIRKVFISGVNMKGKVLALKPVFAKPPEELSSYVRVESSAMRIGPARGTAQNERSTSYSLVQRVDCLGFQLDESSPGKDVGAGVCVPGSLLPTGVDNSKLPGAAQADAKKQPKTPAKEQPKAPAKEQAKPAGEEKDAPAKDAKKKSDDDEGLLSSLKNE